MFAPWTALPCSSLIPIALFCGAFCWGRWRPASWHPWQMGRLCVCVCFFLPLLSLRGFNQARSIRRHGPGFNAWPFLDSIRATNNAHAHAFVLNFKEDGSGLDRLESFHYYGGKNGRLGESILNAEGTPSERVRIPILPMTKARPDHPNLPLG